MYSVSTLSLAPETVAARRGRRRGRRDNEICIFFVVVVVVVCFFLGFLFGDCFWRRRGVVRELGLGMGMERQIWEVSPAGGSSGL